MLSTLKDTGGATFLPAKFTFSTVAGTVYSEFPAAARKVALPTSQLPQTPPDGSKVSSRSMPSYTGVTIGPDHKLYATVTDGRIIRFEINDDATLGEPQTIQTVRETNGDGDTPADRLVTGLVFDPASTATDLRAWVAHGEPIGFKLNDWTGKVSLLTGPDLEHCQDYVVHLPRAEAGPRDEPAGLRAGRGLYFCQASNTAMGAPDHEWGYRAEHLLTACIIRVDTKAIHSPPVDVKTEYDGKYDPYAPARAVTI